MKKIVRMATVGVLLSCAMAQAEEINYQSMQDAGFGDVAELLQQMPPGQQNEVLKQAAIRKEDLKKLSPEELQRLRVQLRNVADTIYMSKVDPDKLDPAKAGSTDETLKTLDAYQKKYDQGKIKNDVVRPPDSDQ